ncbi:MAG TPA: cytochrome c1 [Burkholderiales bacterium]|jgi:ubiquinol-cytochrome c reductase cytochrome c1 subunit
MKKLLLAFMFVSAALLAIPLAAWAEEGYRLDRAPIDPKDLLSLQSGARTFVNYCLNCHGAQFMRYNRLTDLGLTEQEIRDNLIFTDAKVGDTMKVALTAKDGKAMFGVAPPDLSVVARARGADWLYTYLRTFYRDPKTPTGWNNAVFPTVAMPDPLWALQGERAYGPAPKEAKEGEDKAGEGEHGDEHEMQWTQITPGTQDEVQYDTTVRDLVNFLVYMGEPAAVSRKRIGIAVLFALGVLFIFAYALKKEYWKDVH